MQTVMVEKEHSDDILHYGVKGMKWGVRKTIKNIADRQSAKREKEEEKLKQVKSKYGAGGVALYAGSRHMLGRVNRKMAATILNSSVNGINVNPYLSYNVKLGANVVRKIGMGYLTLSEYTSAIRTGAQIVKANYM